MLQFSVIIPVFNRPDELRELLTSLEKRVIDGLEEKVVRVIAIAN